MSRILYGVSAIGLGHATRAVAVGQRLVAGGAEVKFVSGGPPVECLRGYGFDAEDVVTGAVPWVRGGEMKNAAAWYFRAWQAVRKGKQAIKGVVAGWTPDFIVSDEEFSSASLALEMGTPHAMITDELELGFAKTWLARKVESRVSEWYVNLQRRVALLIIPDKGRDEGNRRYVGPIVRTRTRTKDEVLEEFGLPSRARLLLLALSGAGIGGFLLDKATRTLASIPDSALVVMGNRGRKVTGERIFDVGVVREGQNLVAAADLVLSTAGKSTIDEAASFGTPIIAIPIGNHGEQERNAAVLGYRAGDIERLPELIASRIGKREAARSSGGAQAASRLILSAL